MSTVEEAGPGMPALAADENRRRRLPKRRHAIGKSQLEPDVLQALEILLDLEQSVTSDKCPSLGDVSQQNFLSHRLSHAFPQWKTDQGGKFALALLVTVSLTQRRRTSKRQAA